jgi:hypothetical protein
LKEIHIRFNAFTGLAKSLMFEAGAMTVDTPDARLFIAPESYDVQYGRLQIWTPDLDNWIKDNN